MNDPKHLENLKVADFGLSLKFGIGTRLLKERCGTLLYMAPEFINDTQYSKPVDIWGCGIIAFEILELFHPFYRKSITKSQICERIRNSKFSFRNSSSLAKDLINKLTMFSPSERYSAEQALNHPFITRNLLSEIPFTHSENNVNYENSCKLVQVRFFFLFSSDIKGHNGSKEDIFNRKIKL